MICFAAVLILPFLAGAVCFLLKNEKTVCRVFSVVTGIMLALTPVLIMQVTGTGNKILTLWQDTLALDLFGALLMLLTMILFFMASLYLPGYLRADRICTNDPHTHDPRTRPGIFAGCLLLFLGTMMLVLSAQNFGLLWVAVEATTLASAPLISYHRSGHSLEAMWKYLLICSVGIGFALLGTMCLSLAGHFSDAGNISDLSFTELSKGMHPGWFKAAFIFILAGYGTKMGLAPFHTWLPDAHSESPAIVSALLSGTLLNCAFLGITRVVAIASPELQVFCNELLIFSGIFSILVSALFIIRQNDFKRMLAYSSVEHMGLIALAWGLCNQQAAALHIAGHTMLKGMLFLLAGNILSAYGTRTISHVTGMFARTPKNAVLWLIGVLAICGTPPSPLFVSEYLMIRTMIFSGNLWLAIVLAVLLFAVFAGMSVAFFNMLFGAGEEPAPPQGSCAEVEKNSSVPRILCTAVLLAGCVFLFFLLKGAF